MLSKLTWRQFLEWQAFDRISPIGDRRGDWQAASVASACANAIAMFSGSRKRFKVADFLLEFTDEPRPAAADTRPRESEAEMKMFARMMVALSHAEDKKPGARRRR